MISHLLFSRISKCYLLYVNIFCTLTHLSLNEFHPLCQCPSQNMVFRVEVFMYFLTIAGYRETNFINFHTTLLSNFSKITKLELNDFKIFFTMESFIHSADKSGIPQIKVEFFSLKWKEDERVQNLNYFNFFLVSQGSPRRIQRIWKPQI